MPIFRRMYHYLLVLGAAGLLATGHGQAYRPSYPDKQSSQAIDALERINESARAAYRAARDRVLARTGPIVLFNGEDLVFRYGETRRVSKPIPALYTDLKTVGHVALGLASLLNPAEEREISSERLFACKGYLETIEDARKAIRQRDLTKAQQERQKKILLGCRDLLNEVLRTKTIDAKKVPVALRKLQPLLDANSDEAARAEIDGLHREMTRWKAKLTEAEWGKLFVVIQSSAMPRKKHLAVQYFSRLLNEPGEGRRIIYAEALFDEQRALNLLGTHLLDTQIGSDFFGDPKRMHRDLLADAATAYLDELFKKEKQPPDKTSNR